jgi:zinc transporter
MCSRGGPAGSSSKDENADALPSRAPRRGSRYTRASRMKAGASEGAAGGDGLISAFILDGSGGATEVGWDVICTWKPEQGPLWVHLNREDARTREWLDAQSDLEPWVREALLAEETRPRVTTSNGALLVNLRGVNLNPDTDPEDMVSIRIWIDRNRVISTRKRHLMAVADVREKLAQGVGPKTAADVVVMLAGRLVERMGPIIGALDEHVVDAEDQVLSAHGYELRTELAMLRRQAIALRRYVGPQREAMTQLQSVSASWMEDTHRLQLREISDRITRYVEDLDASRERAAVTMEELSGRLAEQMNRTMYMLSIVATIFLPLSLLTGLLGINVAGIPGSEYPGAFLLVTAALVLIGVAEVVFFWRRRLF